MDPLRDTIERALGAQYDVLRLIGRGGMGAVYLARERLLERLVAVKVLPHEAAMEHGGRERFLREARTAAKLSHPNIVPLYSFAEAEGTFCYVMGYVEGESLESRLARDGRVPGDEARRILAEIADALDYAHRQGVVHRDVKPDNILIEAATGRAVLTDFGVARQSAQQGTLTRTGVIVGTPHYMSPEQAGGERVDGRSDLYALGVVGYRMLTGRLPIEGASLQEVLVAHMTREPTPPVVSAADAPAVSAIMRCLRKEPTERWPSGRALAAALKPGEQDLELPDELTALPSFAVKVAVGLFAFDVVLGAVVAYRPSPGDAATLLGSVALLPAAVGVFAAIARRHGMSWRDAFAMQWWTPATWWGWWPSRLRRPGDLWNRTPFTVRLARTILTAATVTFGGFLLPALVLTLASSAGDNFIPGNWVSQVFTWMAPVAMVTLSAGVALTLPWRRRFGLPKKIAERLSWEPTWNNAKFWGRPEVAALLSGAPEGSAPRTPDQLVAAIEREVAALPEPFRDGVRGCDAAARELVRAIAAADAELADLARHSEPGERERLDQKVADLQPMAGEPESRRQMRELLSGQLALLQRMDARRQQLADDRDRHLALLKNLWDQLATLRAEAAGDARAVGEITGKVQAICDEVVRQREAIRVVEELSQTSARTAQ